MCGGDKQAGSIVLSGGRDVGTLESDVKSFDVHESVHRDTIMEVTNKMQLYRLIYYSYSALHVSGHVFAHHQEHLTVFTASGNIHQCRCRLVSWLTELRKFSSSSSKTSAGSHLGEYYQML